MKAKTKYLKATKVARSENLIFSGFDLSADFFTLTYNRLSTLKDVTLYLIFGALCYAIGLYIGKHWNK